MRQNCRGRLKVVEDAATLITEHGHPPDLAKIEAAKFVSDMRRWAAVGVKKPRQIIQHSTGRISLEAANLYSITTSNWTNKETDTITVSESDNSCRDCHSGYSQTYHEECSELRSLGFWRRWWQSYSDVWNRRELNTLEQHRHWFMEGTFKVVPGLFFQVFTIHALVDRSAVPLIYVLLLDKSEATYLYVFQKLHELRATLNPLSIMADFEKASQNAVRQVFPTVQMVECLFHLGQCLWRKVQDLH